MARLRAGAKDPPTPPSPPIRRNLNARGKAGAARGWNSSVGHAQVTHLQFMMTGSEPSAICTPDSPDPQISQPSSRPRVPISWM